MKTQDGQQLFAEYAKTGSNEAFSELVAHYIDPIYSTALRQVGGDRHLAEDVTQTVFIDLARKAPAIASTVTIGGWLHQHTRFVASKAVRTERRRKAREQQAVEMNSLQEPSESFAKVAPILDEAIAELGAPDKTAILLRFFERQDFHSVGQALGTSEDAARMRVARAMEKLHKLLARRGVALSLAGLGTGLTTEMVKAAPAHLAIRVTASVQTAVLATTTPTALSRILMLVTTPNVAALLIVAVLAVTLLTTRRLGQSSPAQPGAATAREVASVEHSAQPGSRAAQNKSQTSPEAAELDTLTANLRKVLYGPITDETGGLDGGTKIAIALRAFGQQKAAAIPILLETLADPKETGSSPREMASWGFHYLGREADTAIPALIELFSSPTQSTFIRIMALQSLSGIASNAGGTPSPDPSSIAVALPQVLALLKDPNSQIRGQASTTLGSMGSYASPAVPSLVYMLQSDDIQTRLLAATTAGYIGPFAQNTAGDLANLLTYSPSRQDALAQLSAAGQNPSQVTDEAIRAKMDELTRSARGTALTALGRIGPAAKDTVPLLLALMNNASEGAEPAPLPTGRFGFYSLPKENSEPELRVKAAIALWQVAGRADGALLIAQTLYPPRADEDWWDQRLSILAEMGPSAQIAVPILVKMRGFNDPRFHAGERVSEALAKITSTEKPATQSP